jgi:N-methylhydantoinase B
MKPRAVLDPVTLEVVQAYLISTVREMRANMASSGWNIALVETLDFSCGLVSPDAELIAMSEDIPNHVFAIAYHAQLARDTYGAELFPGDVLVTNDPYTGGPHLNDILMLYPYFVGSELTMMIAIRAHWADMGGKNVGSIAGQSHEIYEEGIQLPLVKMANRGVVADDLLATLLANVRNSDEAHGDFLAMMGTCKQAAHRLDELVDRYGIDVVTTSVEAILSRSQQVVEKRVSELPVGEYFYEEYLESDGFTTDPIRAECTLTVTGKELIFDFTGTAAQMRGPMNAGPAVAYTGTFVMVKSFLEPATPVNGGAMRPIQVVIPSGTFMSATSPTPVGGFAEVVYIAEHVVLGLLAQVIPDRVGAPPEVGANHTYLTGWDAEHERHWISYEYPRGGTAASWLVDGSNAVCQYDLGDIVCTVPVERADLEYPLIVETHNLKPDSGGPGFRRGGLGSRRTIRVTDPAGCRLNLVGEEAIIPRLGMAGGFTGSLNRFTIIRDGEEFIPGGVPSKAGSFPLLCGDVLVMQARGGSGWGDPLTREPERVLADVEAGYVTREHARDAYGVVIRRGRLDPAATAERRDSLRLARNRTTVVTDRTDEYDAVGRRRCRLSRSMARRLGVRDDDLIEYVPAKLGPHLKAWVTVDAKLKDTDSPLGPRGRSIMKARKGSKILIRPLEPPD